MGPRGRSHGLPKSERIKAIVKIVHLFLQRRYLRIHLLELLRVLEAIAAAVRSILALELEVSAPLTWCIAVAFDFSPFAFVAEALISSHKRCGGIAKIDSWNACPSSIKRAHTKQLRYICSFWLWYVGFHFAHLHSCAFRCRAPDFPHWNFGAVGHSCCSRPEPRLATLQGCSDQKLVIQVCFA